MQVDPERITRLVKLSLDNAYDHHARFSWPEQLSTDQLWCDEDLLTTYGTEVHGRLSESQIYALSKWEAINFFSLNVHGIKKAIEFVCDRLYSDGYSDISEYMHIFIDEENVHMWFFARFCLQYAGKIYPTLNVPLNGEGAQRERDFNMFASTLIFEEFVDYYNKKVGVNPHVATIIREINHQHHVDESRHVSFGREIVKALHQDIVNDDEEARQRLATSVRNMFGHFIDLMYNPSAYRDAGIVQAVDAANPSALRNRLRNDPSRRQYHGLWFRRTAEFFVRCGIMDNASFLTEAAPQL